MTVSERGESQLELIVSILLNDEISTKSAICAHPLAELEKRRDIKWKRHCSLFNMLADCVTYTRVWKLCEIPFRGKESLRIDYLYLLDWLHRSIVLWSDIYTSWYILVDSVSLFLACVQV